MWRCWGGLLAACLCGGPALQAGPLAGLDQAALLLKQGRLEAALAELQGQRSPGEDSQRRDLLEGLLLHRLKRDGEAAAPLQRALARDPADLEAAIDLGEALQATGRWDQARTAYEGARSRHASKPEPWLGLGQIAAGQGQWAEARRCFQKAADLDPKKRAAWLGLSNALLKAGELRQAAECREKALALDGDDADLQFKQAVAWYGLGDLDRSQKALQAAGLGDRPEAFFLEGCLAYRRGRFEEAERDFLAALASKDGYPQARLNLGIAYYGQQRYDEALAQFDQILAKDDDEQAAAYRREAASAASDHYLGLGSQALLAGDTAAALELLQKSEALAPEQDKAAVERLIQSVRKEQGPMADQLDQRARQALKAKNLPQAVLLWQDALRLDPAHAASIRGLDGVKADLGALKRAYRQAALATAAAGDTAQAEALVQRLRKLDEDAGQDLERRLQEGRAGRSQSLLAAGKAELEKGRPRQALQQFDQALALDGGDRRAQEFRQQAQAALHAQVAGALARALEAEAQGRWQEAYRWMQQALEADPGDLEARQGSRRLAARLDLKRDDARQADDLYYQGVYAYGAGDTEKALALWDQGLRLDPAHGPLKEAERSARIKLKTLASLGKP